MKLGVTSANKTVRISTESNNRHIVMYGESGSGKSCRSKLVLDDATDQGKTTIVFALENVSINKDKESINHIDLLKDGINLSLLDDGSSEEKSVAKIEYIKALITGSETFGCRQIDALRSAIEYAITNRAEEQTELAAIKAGLDDQGTSIAKGVKSKLWALLESDVLKKSGKSIVPGRINIIDLGGIAESVQTITMELILGIVWRQAKLAGEKDTGNKEEVLIFLDEFQRLMVKDNSVINAILEQGRKYEITLMLATQSTSYVSKAVMDHLNGTSITLYFKPNKNDPEKFAKLIDSEKVEHYATKLKSLKKGESYVTGKITIDGIEYDKPLLIRTVCSPKINGKQKAKVILIEGTKSREM